MAGNTNLLQSSNGGQSMAEMFAARAAVTPPPAPAPVAPVVKSRINTPIPTADTTPTTGTTPPANPPVNPPAPTPTPSPTPTSSTDSALTTALNTSRSRLENIVTAVPEAPKTEAELIAQRRTEAQGVIDAINKQFDSIIQGERDAGNIRNDRTRALNIAAGLSGSDFASAAATKTEKDTQKIIDARNAERATAIQTILYNTDARAREDAAALSAKYKNDAEGALKALNEQRTAARADIAGLANIGMTADELLKKDPELYKAVLAQSGYTEAGLKLFMAANQNQGTKLGESEANGKKYFFYRNADGTVKTVTVDVPGLADGDKLIMAPDGTPLIYGNGKVSIAEGFTQGQFAKPTDTTAADKRNEEYQKALQLVADNPDKSSEELAQYLRANTSLPESDIQFAIGKTITKSAIDASLNLKTVTDYFEANYTPDQIKTMAEKAGYSAGGFLGIGSNLPKALAEFYTSEGAKKTAAEGIAKQYEATGYTIK